jgi:hypothetical protein
MFENECGLLYIIHTCIISKSEIHMKCGRTYTRVPYRYNFKSYRYRYYTGPVDTYFADLGWPKLEYRSFDFAFVREVYMYQVCRYETINIYNTYIILSTKLKLPISKLLLSFTIIFTIDRPTFDNLGPSSLSYS